MAGQDTTVVYKAIANFAALNAAIDKTKAKIKELRAEEASANASSLAESDFLARARDGQAKSLEGYAKKLKSYKALLDSVASAESKIGSGGGNTKSVKAQSDAIDKLNERLEKMQKLLRQSSSPAPPSNSKAVERGGAQDLTDPAKLNKIAQAIQAHAVANAAYASSAKLAHSARLTESKDYDRLAASLAAYTTARLAANAADKGATGAPFPSGPTQGSSAPRAPRAPRSTSSSGTSGASATSSSPLDENNSSASTGTEILKRYQGQVASVGKEVERLSSSFERNSTVAGGNYEVIAKGADALKKMREEAAAADEGLNDFEKAGSKVARIIGGFSGSGGGGGGHPFRNFADDADDAGRKAGKLAGFLDSLGSAFKRGGTYARNFASDMGVGKSQIISAGGALKEFSQKLFSLGGKKFEFFNSGFQLQLSLLIPLVSALGAAINPLIAVLGGAGEAVIALGANFASLAGSALAVPGILGAIVSAAAAVKIAFGGITGTNGVFALAAKAKQSSAKAGASSTYGSTAADQSHAQLLYNRALVDSQRDIAKASLQVRSAQLSEVSAQQSLNDARKTAKKDLDDLTKSVQRAATAELQARADLQTNKEALADVLADPSATKGQKMEARAALAESKDNLTDTLSTNKQNAADLKTAKANGGITPADQLALEQAKVNLEQAKQATADAKIAAQRAKEDAPYTVAQAKQALSTSGSSSTSSADADAYKAALAKLSTSAQGFVKALQAAAPAWSALKKTIQETFFSQLVGDFGKIKDLIPLVGKVLTPVAAAVGKFFDKVLNLVTNSDWSKDIGLIGTLFGQVLTIMGNGLLSLLGATKDLIIAAGPFTKRLLGFLADGAANLASIISQARKDGSLKDWLKTVGDRLEVWYNIVSNLAGVIFNYGAAAAGLGDDLSKSFEAMTKGWLSSSEKAREPGSKFQKFLTNIRPLLKEIKGLIHDVFKGISDIMEDGSSTTATSTPGSGSGLSPYLTAGKGKKAGQVPLSNADPSTANNTISQATDLVKKIRDFGNNDLGPLLKTLGDSGLASNLVEIAGALAKLFDDIYSHGGIEVLKLLFSSILLLLQIVDGIAQTPGGAVGLTVLTVIAGLSFFGVGKLVTWLGKIAKLTFGSAIDFLRAADLLDPSKFTKVTDAVKLTSPRKAAKIRTVLRNRERNQNTRKLYSDTAAQADAAANGPEGVLPSDGTIPMKRENDGTFRDRAATNGGEPFDGFSRGDEKFLRNAGISPEGSAAATAESESKGFFDQLKGLLKKVGGFTGLSETPAQTAARASQEATAAGKAARETAANRGKLVDRSKLSDLLKPDSSNPSDPEGLAKAMKAATPEPAAEKESKSFFDRFKGNKPAGPVNLDDLNAGLIDQTAKGLKDAAAASEAGGKDATTATKGFWANLAKRLKDLNNDDGFIKLPGAPKTTPAKPTVQPDGSKAYDISDTGPAPKGPRRPVAAKPVEYGKVYDISETGKDTGGIGKAFSGIADAVKGSKVAQVLGKVLDSPLGKVLKVGSKFLGPIGAGLGAIDTVGQFGEALNTKKPDAEIQRLFKTDPGLATSLLGNRFNDGGVRGAANGASIGSLFGPAGALIGGGAGYVAGGAASVIKAAGGIKGVPKLLGQAAGGLPSAIGALPSEYVSGLNSMPWAKGLNDFGYNAADNVRNNLAGIGKTAGQVGGAVGKVAKGVGANFADGGKQIAQGVTGAIKGIGDFTKPTRDAATAFGAALGKGFSVLVNGGKIGKTKWVGLAHIFDAKNLKKALDALADFTAPIRDFFGHAASVFRNAFNVLVNGGKIGKAKWVGLAHVFDPSAWIDINPVFADVLKIITGWVTDQVQGFKDFAKNVGDVIGTVWNFLTGNSAKATPKTKATTVTNGTTQGRSHYATGGFVGQLGRTAEARYARGSDTVPAMLTPGEFIMRKSAVQRIGTAQLHAMNSGQQAAAYFADGGLVGIPSLGLPASVNTPALQQSVSSPTVNDRSIAIHGLVINNPVPERGSKSVARKLRSMAYFGSSD